MIYLITDAKSHIYTTDALKLTYPADLQTHKKCNDIVRRLVPIDSWKTLFYHQHRGLKRMTHIPCAPIQYLSNNSEIRSMTPL